LCIRQTAALSQASVTQIPVPVLFKQCLTHRAKVITAISLSEFCCSYYLYLHFL